MTLAYYAAMYDHVYILTHVQHESENKISLYACDIWCIYRFGGLIDGYSALGVVYEVSLEVVLTTHAWCAGDAGIAIWRARLFAAH